MCVHDELCFCEKTVCPTCSACPARIADQEQSEREGTYTLPGFTSHAKWAHEHTMGKAKPNGEW